MIISGLIRFVSFSGLISLIFKELPPEFFADNIYLGLSALFLKNPINPQIPAAIGER